MYKQIIYTLLVLAVLSSCEEPFIPDISKAEYESVLVVDGTISTEEGPFRIRLSRSLPIDADVDFLPEDGAQVLITDDDGNVFHLFDRGNGWYETAENNLRAQIGVKYNLIIRTADGGAFESSEVEVLSCPEIEKVHYKTVTRTSFSGQSPQEELWVEVMVNTKGDTNDTRFLKWKFIETWEVRIPSGVYAIKVDGTVEGDHINTIPERQFCWITDTSSVVLLGSAEKQELNELSNCLIKSIPPKSTKLYFRYSILVEQYALDKEAYRFWKKVEDSNQNLGDMFDKTPCSAYGNITCCETGEKVLGCFMACDVKEKRFFIDEIPEGIHARHGYEECVYTYVDSPDALFFGTSVQTDLPIYGYVEKCVDCTSQGSNVKPSFW